MKWVASRKIRPPHGNELKCCAFNIEEEEEKIKFQLRCSRWRLEKLKLLWFNHTRNDLDDDKFYWFIILCSKRHIFNCCHFEHWCCITCACCWQSITHGSCVSNEFCTIEHKRSRDHQNFGSQVAWKNKNCKRRINPNQ